MSSPIGVELGISKCCVSALVNGKIEIIENDFSSRSTPSYVSFTNTDVLVGQSALTNSTIDPINTVFGFKKLLGKNYDEVTSEDMKVSNLAPVQNHDGKPAYRIRYREKVLLLFPEQILAILLSKLKSLVQKRLKCTVEEAVISVPTNFTNAQRQATENAATIAGLKVLRLISDPAATGLVYATDKIAKINTKLLIVDFGGSKLNLSLVNVKKNKLEVERSTGSSFGGCDIDSILMDSLRSELERTLGISVKSDDILKAKLRLCCEKIKKDMSILPYSKYCIEKAFQNQEYCFDMAKETFEMLLTDEVEKRVRRCVSSFLTQINFFKEDNISVLVAGGATRMPIYEKVIRNIVQRKLNKNVDLTESVAYGAGIQAVILSQQNSYQTRVFDKLSTEILIEELDHSPTPWLNKLTYPSLGHEDTFVLEKGQKRFWIREILPDGPPCDLGTLNLGKSSQSGSSDLFCTISESGIFYAYAKSKKKDKLRQVVPRPDENSKVQEMKKMQEDFDWYSNYEITRGETMNKLEDLCYLYKKQLKDWGIAQSDDGYKVVCQCDGILKSLNDDEAFSLQDLVKQRDHLQHMFSTIVENWNRVKYPASIQGLNNHSEIAHSSVFQGNVY